MNRLREAREYVGFSRSEVAGFLGLDEDLISGFKQGFPAADAELEKLSRLYRRPVAWLRGDPAPPVEISPELADLMEHKRLSDNDRGELVAFAEFLGHQRSA